MTKSKFEKGYCRRSNISLKDYRQWFVTLPCVCDYDKCEGWAAIHNTPDMIALHMELYAPKEEK